MPSRHRVASILKTSHLSCRHQAAAVIDDPLVTVTVFLVTAPPSNFFWTVALPQICAVGAVAAHPHQAVADFHPGHFDGVTACLCLDLVALDGLCSGRDFCRDYGRRFDHVVPASYRRDLNYVVTCFLFPFLSQAVLYGW